MSDDATFEDGAERPLYIGVQDVEDLRIVSSLVQDAVLAAKDICWIAKRHRFAMLLNRFRWEDRPRAELRGRPPERVQSVLAFENVLSVHSQGIDRADKGLVLSILTVAFEETEQGAGHITMTLAGDGALRLKVEALEASLRDVTRPYLAPSNKVPQHPA